MKSRIINDPIFKFGWIVCTNCTCQEAINLYAKKIHIDSWKVPKSRHVANFSSYEPNHNGVFWFKEPPKKTPDIVAHEIVHALTYMGERLGIPLKQKTEEFYGYYTQWLFGEICK